MATQQRRHICAASLLQKQKHNASAKSSARRDGVKAEAWPGVTKTSVNDKCGEPWRNKTRPHAEKCGGRAGNRGAWR